MIAKKTRTTPWEIAHLVICRGRSGPRGAAYWNTTRVYINHTRACLNHTHACLNQASVCGNHNFACKNHSLRVKITVVLVEIALCMYTLHSCVLKSHSACRYHTRACVMKIERVSKNIFKNLHAKVSFHTLAYIIFSTRVGNDSQQNLKIICLARFL
jgi:hypothetical protein